MLTPPRLQGVKMRMAALEAALDVTLAALSFSDHTQLEEISDFTARWVVLLFPTYRYLRR